MEQPKKTQRRKKTLSSFSESEEKLLERLKRMKEEKKKYISKMFETIFTEILNNDELLEILDENKDNKNFQEKLSNVLKDEIEKCHYNNNQIIEEQDLNE